MVSASALWLSSELLLLTMFSAGRRYFVTVDLDRAPVIAHRYDL